MTFYSDNGCIAAPGGCRKDGHTGPRYPEHCLGGCSVNAAEEQECASQALNTEPTSKAGKENRMASYKEVSFIQYAAKAVAAAVVTFIGGWLVKNGVSVDTSLGEVIQVASLSLVTGVATFAKKNVPKF